VAALVPAFLVGLFGLLPVGKRPHLISSRPAPDTSAPATTAPAASSPGNGKLLHAPSPKIVPRAPDFTVKTALQIDRPLAPGNYVWDESGVPPGRVAIVVDIKQQLIFVYRGGDEIGRSTLIYGDDDKPTPLGVFPILEKDADHHSKTYWNAPMPFMLRLTPDGVSLHGTAFIDPNYATRLHRPAKSLCQAVVSDSKSRRLCEGHAGLEPRPIVIGINHKTGRTPVFVRATRGTCART